MRTRALPARSTPVVFEGSAQRPRGRCRSRHRPGCVRDGSPARALLGVDSDSLRAVRSMAERRISGCWFAGVPMSGPSSSARAERGRHGAPRPACRTGRASRAVRSKTFGCRSSAGDTRRSTTGLPGGESRPGDFDRRLRAPVERLADADGAVFGPPHRDLVAASARRRLSEGCREQAPEREPHRAASSPMDRLEARGRPSALRGARRPKTRWTTVLGRTGEDLRIPDRSTLTWAPEPGSSDPDDVALRHATTPPGGALRSPPGRRVATVGEWPACDREVHGGSLRAVGEAALRG